MPRLSTFKGRELAKLSGAVALTANKATRYLVHMARTTLPRNKATPARRVAPISHMSTVPQPEGAEDANYITGVARTLSVIRAFAYQHDRLTLAEIGRIVELPRPTVRRFLITLVALGYVESDGKYFNLSPKVLTLSQAYFSSSSLPHVARPFIEQVSQAVNGSCSISVLAGDEIIYVARSSRKRPASIDRDVGVNLPAYCTSMGRMLLAHLSPEQLDSYFARVPRPKYNERTVTDEAELRAILRQVREQDFSVIDGELEPSLRGIAVPVRNRSGFVVAAAHINSDAKSVTLEKLQRLFLPALQDAVIRIREALI